MSIRDIPVRAIGPGSQAEPGQGPRYIDMPHEMATFSAPDIPEPDAVVHLEGARETMRWLGEALRDFRPGGGPLIANLAGLDAENRILVNQILGEGEVSIAKTGEVPARCQESVLAGVWRTLYLDDDDRVICDLLEVGNVPHLLSKEGKGGEPIDLTIPDAVDGIANAMPILFELHSHAEAFERDGSGHAINLSLLPLSEAETAFLDERLGRGSLDVLSRGYGRCQVTSTGTPNVWWVRFYNSMGTLILNSLEVAAVPEVVKAASEDLRDSAERLDEILAPYWQDEQ